MKTTMTAGTTVVVEGSKLLAKVVEDKGRWVLVRDWTPTEMNGQVWEVQRDRVSVR